MLTVTSRPIQMNNIKLLYGAFLGSLTFIVVSTGVLASEPINSNSASKLGGVVKLNCDIKSQYLETKDCSVGGDSGLQLSNEPIRVEKKKQPCLVQAGAGNNSFNSEYAYCVEIR